MKLRDKLSNRAMPKTLSKKIEKHRLRAQAESDLARLWDRDRAGVKVMR
jgi:hypothetical protein